MSQTTPDIEIYGRDARRAARALAQLEGPRVTQALETVAGLLRDRTGDILTANRIDVEHAEGKGLTPAMIDRLRLDKKRIAGIADGVLTVAALPDPSGKILSETTRPNGLVIRKVSVPIGVLGMIYESRPNVTIDAAALALKSRNAIILRGGSESFHSSMALFKIFREGLEKDGLPGGAVQMIETTDRALVGEMLKADHLIDVMIPRGGRSLIARVRDEARMPVFSHLDGLCHIFIDESASPDIARDVVLNAKMRRTGICGATETLLVHKDFPKEDLKAVLATLIENGCEIRGDEDIRTLMGEAVLPAGEDDWKTEYLEAILSVRIVPDLEAAIAHINSYGSHHTDSILTEDRDAADTFFRTVESAIVMHNASTQFADGGEFGMGAEIGIATGKLHARGPVGVEQLMTYHYRVFGSGQTRPK